MCKLFRDVHLPATFCSKAWGPSVALRDFELGYTHSKASLAEAVSIERDLFLNIEHTYPLFEPLLREIEVIWVCGKRLEGFADLRPVPKTRIDRIERLCTVKGFKPRRCLLGVNLRRQKRVL